MKRDHGCGFRDEYRDRALLPPMDPEIDPDEPGAKTCGQYYLRTVFVQSVINALEDYRRGALGDVRLLPSPMLEYLRLADNAVASWRNQQDQKLAGG